jgi:hypothetical protein
MGIMGDPKNLRLSVHNKYKRKLKSLSRMVDDFLRHAEMKLDKSVAGKIYKREAIEDVVEQAKKLATLLPTPEGALDCPPVREDFLEVLQQADGNAGKIIADAEAFLKGLSKEGWDEMAKTYNSTEK